MSTWTEIARGTGTGSAATVTATVGDITPLTSGHIVVAAAFNDNEVLDAADISDTDTMTWQLDDQHVNGANVSIYVFSAEILSGSVDDGHTFTVNNNGVSASQRTIIVYHVAGLTSTTWVDENGRATGSSTTLSATLDASTDEAATAVFGAGNIISDASLGWTPNGTDGDVVNAFSTRSMVTSWHFETTAGQHSEGGTADATGNWAFVVVAYIEQAGGSELGPKRIAGPTSIGTSAGTLFTVPAGTSYRIETMSVSNPTASAIDFTLSIGTDAAATRYYDGLSIEADSEKMHHLYLVLGAGEIMQAFGSATGLVLTLDGTAF